MTLDAQAVATVAGAVFTEHGGRGRVPALSWGVVEHGVLVAHGGDPGAVFRIASMTKSFTAAAVLSLRDEGLLRLDDPIALHARELAAVRGPGDSPPVTIRHLLTMSSGLATDDPWADRHLDIGDDELDALVLDGLAFASTTATVFEYSNLGYGLLGRVVRHVAGVPVQQLVTERFLRPLGMASTRWVAPAGALAGYRRRDLTDPDDLVQEPFVGDGAIAPMGGLYSTVADLATWVGFFTDAFPARVEPDGGPLSRASRREMQQVSRAYLDTVGGYGMGLNVLQHPKLGTVVTHSGGLPGFGSNMRWLPLQGVGLIALANSTYAWMAKATGDALDALADAGLVGPASIDADDVLVGAASALIGLHNAWDDTAAAALFADNVAADLSFTARRTAAERLLVDHGPFSLARVEAESATSAVAVAHGAHSELRVDFQLAPVGRGRVQYYDTEVAG